MIQEAREPIQIRLRRSERHVLTQASKRIGVTRSAFIRITAIERALAIMHPDQAGGANTPSNTSSERALAACPPADVPAGPLATGAAMTSSMTPDPKAESRVDSARQRAHDAQQRDQQADPTAGREGAAPEVASALDQSKALER